MVTDGGGEVPEGLLRGTATAWRGWRGTQHGWWLTKRSHVAGRERVAVRAPRPGSLRVCVAAKSPVPLPLGHVVIPLGAAFRVVPAGDARLPGR